MNKSVFYPGLRRVFSGAAAGGLAALALVTAGCAVGPRFAPPQPTMPAAWQAGGRTTDDGIQKSEVGSQKSEVGGQPSAPSPNTQHPAAVPPPDTHSPTPLPADALVRWWEQFNDPVLNSLVTRAAQTNLDIRLAESRLRQARAELGVTDAGLWPQLNMNGSAQRSRSPGPGGNGVIGNSFQAGFDAAWELDIFGGTRRAVEAAEADLAAAQESRRDVLVSLLAELAVDYVALRGSQRRLVIARENLAMQQHSAELTRLRFKGGLASALDVANAAAQVASTAAQLPMMEAASQQTIHALCLLLACEPGALTAELSRPGAIPLAPAGIPVGVPSDLLRRRPDIRNAEAQIHGATARIGVALADLFPKFTLSGNAGLSGNKPHTLVDMHNRFWSFGPSATWPIFDAGRILSNVRVQRALQEQALLTYEKTVLTALQEVENALVVSAREQEHVRLLQEAVTANRKALNLALQLYTEGQTDFLSVIEAQRSLYGAEEALALSDQAVATDLISLYKALGGGWKKE